MKLNLDFSLYKGTTMLKNWWKAVKSHFETVQEAHNALDTALSDETAARKKTDTALSAEVTNRTNADNNLQQKITDETADRVNGDAVLDGRITTEVTVRANADTALQRNIDTEMSSRQNADTVLDKKISDEAAARKDADTALDERITAVEDKAHTHANKTVLDSISETDIEHWNGILEQITQTQLDAVKAYLQELCFSFADEFQRVYAAIGVTAYDSGIFGMEQNDIVLDGGDFTDEITGTVDCGGFEPITIAVIDGGEY